MPVTHVVMFGFKPDTAPEAIQQCCDDMLGLKDKCVSASTGKPYVASSKGGRDISIEGLQNGLTHAFVVEFDSVSDRDYYVKEDKEHHAFVQRYAGEGGVLAKITVLDFTPGSFA